MKKTNRAIYVIAFLMMLLALSNSCTKYPAQKHPWPVGYKILYFQNNGLDYKAQLQVDSEWLDNVDVYDNAYHYKYNVHVINGTGSYTSVIDYQLGTKPYNKPFWTYIWLNGHKDSTLMTETK